MIKNVTLEKVLDGFYLTIAEAKKRADGSTRSITRSTFIAEDEFEEVYRVLFMEHFKKEDLKLKQQQAL